MAVERTEEAERIRLRLKEVRFLRGWSTKELAEKANVSQTTIEHFEGNIWHDIRISSLTKLMKALGVSFELNLVENIPVPEEKPPALVEDEGYVTNIARAIGYLLRTERIKMKIPYSVIEREIKMSRALVKRWERGNMTRSVLSFLKLLDFLDLELYIEKRPDKNKDWETEDE